MSDNNENKYSGTHSRIKKLRYVIIAILVIFVVFALFSYREDLTLENLRYLMKYVDVKPMSFGSPDNTQINFEPDSATVTASFKEDLVVLTKTSLKIYDLSSKEILDSSHSLTSPAIAMGDRYFAVYDLGARYIAVYNSFSKLWEETMDYPINDVAIDGEGNICISTGAKGRTSAIVAFDSRFEKIVNWESTDKYSITTDIHYDDDVYIAIGTIRSTDKGDILSELSVISKAQKGVISTLSFNSELVLKLAFNDDGNIVYLTDSALRIVTVDGRLLAEQYFKPKSLRKLDVGGEWTVLLLNENLVGKQHSMFIFDGKGNTYMESTINSEITDLCISDKYAFLLGVEDVSVVDLDKKKVSTYDSDRSYRAVELLDEENVYLIYDGLAVALGVKEE